MCLVIFGISIAVLASAGKAASQLGGETPAELEGIEIVDRAGEVVPGDLIFVDEAGESVRLARYFEGGRPVLLQLVYYDCPMLCTLVLNGYVKGAKELDLLPGKDYEVVSVSFDPADTPELAAAKKKSYVTSLGGSDAVSGWHFLTGEEEQIRVLANALGFRYRWVAEKEEFAHAAGMFVLTPEGKISRTLYGIEFAARDLRLSLVEAAEGRLGTPFDRLLLYCFQYDPETHKYSLVAVNVMKLGALATLIALGAFLTVQWSRERRQAGSSA
jgi:protein SCO1/2